MPVFTSIGLALGVGTAATATAAGVGLGAAFATGLTVTGLAAGAIGASVYKSSAQKTATKKASDHQQYLQGQEIAKLEKLEAKETDAANATELSAEKVKTRDTARNRQRASAASATGRRNTILTSPLGVTGAGATGQRKTLLGT